MQKPYPQVAYIDETQVESLLLSDTLEYINYLQKRIEEISQDASKTYIKPKVIYDDPISPRSGDVRCMTCFTDRVKVVKIIATNPLRQKHWSVSVGSTLLLDFKENHPIAIFEATNMSAIRTSAMAVLGAMFSKVDLSDTLVVGYGRVGSCVSEFVKALGGSVRVYDPALMPQKKLDAFEAKCIITATTSRDAFLHVNNTKADFILSVGADTAFNFELSSELIEQRGGLFVDCFDALHVGDLSQMRDAKNLVQGDILSLSKAKDKIKTLVSVGSPLMDALSVEYMAQKLNLIEKI